jgi:hypothetical protein
VRQLALITLVTALAACATQRSPVTVRADQWRQKLARDLHPGMPKQELLAWADDNQLRFVDGPGSGELVAGVAYVPKPAHGVSQSQVCRGFGISISLKLDATERLLSDEVRTLGNCL